MDIKAIIQAGGGPTKLAASCGLKHSSVCCWKRVPARHIKAVAKATGLPLHEIRADLYEAPQRSAA